MWHQCLFNLNEGNLIIHSNTGDVKDCYFNKCNFVLQSKYMWFFHRKHLLFGTPRFWKGPHPSPLPPPILVDLGSQGPLIFRDQWEPWIHLTSNKICRSYLNSKLMGKSINKICLNFFCSIKVWSEVNCVALYFARINHFPK